MPPAGEKLPGITTGANPAAETMYATLFGANAQCAMNAGLGMDEEKKAHRYKTIPGQGSVLKA